MNDGRRVERLSRADARALGRGQAPQLVVEEGEDSPRRVAVPVPGELQEARDLGALVAHGKEV